MSRILSISKLTAIDLLESSCKISTPENPSTNPVHFLLKVNQRKFQPRKNAAQRINGQDSRENLPRKPTTNQEKLMNYLILCMTRSQIPSYGGWESSQAREHLKYYGKEEFQQEWHLYTWPWLFTPSLLPWERSLTLYGVRATTRQTTYLQKQLTKLN